MASANMMKEIKCQEHLDNMARLGTRPSHATYKKIMAKVLAGEPISDFQLRKAWEYLASDFAEAVPRALRIRTSQWLEKQGKF